MEVVEGEGGYLVVEGATQVICEALMTRADTLARPKRHVTRGLD